MRTVLVVMGTRPEAVKLAPVVLALRERADAARVVLCATSQHRQMLRETLAAFDLAPDRDLDLMRADQRPADLLGRLVLSLTPVLDEVAPDVVVVQGDTLSVMGASLAAFLHGTPVAHVEAGLRTHDKRSPFPEEICRRVAGLVADQHFAPTAAARRALLDERVPAEQILVTGNTGIDALLWMYERVRMLPLRLDAVARDRRLVLVTAHRRESFGAPFRELCLALRDIAEACPDVQIVYPVHLNPNVQEPVRAILGETSGVSLLPPLGYPELVQLLSRATLVLTDSGGIQEEAPTLGKPVLVLREKTERPEAVAAGQALLVGTARARIAETARALLADPRALAEMSRPTKLYGDGRASARIVARILGEPDSDGEFEPE
jgi:UDP-N-acetylglucosamine 2-epimerase